VSAHELVNGRRALEHVPGENKLGSVREERLDAGGSFALEFTVDESSPSGGSRKEYVDARRLGAGVEAALPGSTSGGNHVGDASDLAHEGGRISQWVGEEVEA
jgi:hypothetical protein